MKADFQISDIFQTFVNKGIDAPSTEIPHLRADVQLKKTYSMKDLSRKFTKCII